MQPPEEIEDPEGYCMLKIEKIEAIHGSLRESVQSGHMKPERAEALKNKFEALREALRQKFATERKLVAEKSGLEFENQQQEAKLDKFKQEAKRDQETIALMGEDAEEADAEAAKAVDRCDKALVEIEELKTMRTNYKQRIVEIEREFFVALEPVVARLKQEIKSQEEEIKDGVEKIAQSVKEIADSKACHASILEEIRDLNNDRFEVLGKLEELAGRHETLKKQVDVLKNAIKVIRVQLEKWTVKVEECEQNLHGFKLAIKSKKEEHAQAIASFQKMQLHKQEQERLAKDLAINMDRALADREVYYNDQVHLDLQVVGKLVELKHVQELHVKALREREKALTRVQQVQEQLKALQDSLSTYKQEERKAHKELTIVDEEKAKWEESLAETRKDVERALRSLRDSETLGDDVLKEVCACNLKIQDLEKEMAKMIQEDRQIEAVRNDLEKQTGRLSRLAAQKYTMRKEALENIEIQKGYNKGFLKRVEQLTKEHEDNILSYNNIRSQRNRFMKAVEESGITIAEMRDKIAPLAQQVENLRNDVDYKIKVFDKLRGLVLDGLRASEDVRKDISQCRAILTQKKFIIKEIKLEKHRLEEFIEKKAQMNKKMVADYTIHITRRNAFGLQLMDRNDELSIMYEKFNVQVDLLKFSELEYNKRIDEIRLLRRECERVHNDIVMEKRSAPDPTALFKKFQSLQEQVRTARATQEQLSDLCENPFKGTKRWRQLKGFDLKFIDLERKAWAIQVFINEKENKATEKDIILEELALLLKSEMRKGALIFTKSTELSKKLNENVRNQMNVNRSLVAAISELALVQARAMSMKREKEGALDQLNEAQSRLEAGEPPTEDAEREWEYMEREAAVVRKIEAARQAAKQEEEEYIEAQHCTHVGTRPKTTPNIISRAEKRPNAYHGEPDGQPVPFPVHLPFQPPTQASSVMLRRSTRKPSSSATRMSLVASSNVISTAAGNQLVPVIL